MQYNHAQVQQDPEQGLSLDQLKYPAAAVVALALVYGASYHHLVAVILGLCAAFLLLHRTEQASARALTRQDIAPMGHVDGGSFSADHPPRPLAMGVAPAVIDGGSLHGCSLIAHSFKAPRSRILQR